MRPVLTFLVCAALSGCVFSGDDDDVAGGDEPDASPTSSEPECVPAEDRPSRTVTVSGAVVDWATGEAIAGADVAVNTAWDVGGESFPAGCPTLATLTTTGDGQFGPAEVEIGSPLDPPIAIFLVTGDELGDTASDQRTTCEGADCGDLDHTIAAPSRTLAAGWRAELGRGGMPDADTRGLVLLEYRNPDGTPAEGVFPEYLFGFSGPIPDTEVRFLEPDRAALAPTGTSTTTASGVALIALRTSGNSDFIAGSRGEDSWEAVGVLAPPGWFFLEDREQSPPWTGCRRSRRGPPSKSTGCARRRAALTPGLTEGQPK